MVAPAQRTPLKPVDLPPLVPLDPKAPLAHWQSRAVRAETVGTDLVNKVDALWTELNDRDIVDTRCAQWAEKVAREQSGQ